VKIKAGETEKLLDNRIAAAGVDILRRSMPGPCKTSEHANGMRTLCWSRKTAGQELDRECGSRSEIKYPSGRR